MFQAKCLLLDTARDSLPVIVKSWLEREKNFIKKHNQSNPKRLYPYIKNKQVDNVGVGPLKENDQVYIDGKDSAKFLNS